MLDPYFTNYAGPVTIRDKERIIRPGGIIAGVRTGQTSRVGVYAGVYAVTGAATVIQAVGAGKSAAQTIDAYIRKLGKIFQKGQVKCE